MLPSVRTTQLSQFAAFSGPGAPTPAAGGLRNTESGREAARSYFSELASKFPMSGVLAAEFTQLTIPAATAVPAGKWLWHNLIDFDPWESLNQDVVVFGIWLDMMSPNPSPTTPATQAAWGDDHGMGAAIVVGDKALPGSGMGTATWCNDVSTIAGIDSSVTTVYNSLNQRHFARTFPSGKYTTGWNKRGLNGAIVPFVRRITSGNRIRAAFVLNRTDANAGANKTIDGYVSLEVYFGLTKNPNDINE